MLICLLRHGETDWNNLGRLQGREDVPLNNTGIVQAREAARYLKKHKWQAIISSPLTRAKVTAEIVSQEIGNVKIYEEIGFIERDYGKAAGMTKAEQKAAFYDDEGDMEPFEILQNRTAAALLKYIGQHNGSDIIIVSHGMAINSILAYLSGNREETKKLIPKNASMSLLEKTGDSIKIVYMNKTAAELTQDGFNAGGDSL